MANPANTLAATPAADRTAPDMAAIVKDAALFALVTFGLCVPIIAFRTDLSQTAALDLVPRWGLVAILCGLVFAARLAQRLIVANRDARRALTPSPTQATEAVHAEPNASQKVSSYALPAFLGVTLAFPLLAVLGTGGLGESRYWIDLGILILTYVMLGWGLNIVVGLAGLLDLGYVAFYAVGAYSYALLSTVFGLSFWVCLPLAGLFAGLWGMVLGFPVLRLRGDYLAIVTLAFGEIIRLVLINWTDFSGGAAGISSIPRATFFGVPFTADEDGFAAKFGLDFSPMHRVIFLYYLILALALITNGVTLRLRRLPIGRAWEALREDEIACRSLGINTTNTKLTAFALGAMFGGFAGSFFAVRQGFVSPESFNFLESAIILAIVVLGGMGSQIGVAIAAVAMVGGPELLRNLGFLKAVFGDGFDPSEYRLLLFGLAMVVMMIWRPRGLISERAPSIVLKERKRISGSLVKEGHG
ncbi:MULTISPECIES: high-affinity branched-chain amino acid ABC transporter permease LivM [Methylobacterium]|jgi:branched-chain amino acid transport system permease protein|uniref:high-affinity branched-chain amino acid ABC transporter permease LivM n=1 Tax=Methylobacterium TaxID=407 RepID=UPI0008F1A907|nr:MULTISPECIES: high-affinity branched-chain amino acid ABC transporter permease LivM [Methylobacterium]MBZ6413509.1 high-affinity branched-chain amino acid ABC transporter permease LivM [Methylobacterium sp.]MBK3398410.1 high-affinity branched-chain amino acid ABC transporter permease LivM [Methylobacterium ajmalii]MBK3409030.1 high-affinity branched-chain amino acid ABC transporter permease LivM [Methylobacterium ajmalii]MBK3420817.1 high-affinity branched-chain amino acid ABC transporter pe